MKRFLKKSLKMKVAFSLILFFLLANMELLFYLQTIHTHRYTSPTGIPGNQAVLAGLKDFKNYSAHNGKPKLRSFTKNTP